MSGNFDFPPASTGRTPLTPEETSYLHDTFSAARTRRSDMERRTSGQSQSEAVRRHTERITSVREQLSRSNAVRRSPGMLTSDAQAPISAMRSRPHVVTNERYIRGHRRRNQGDITIPGGASTVQQAVERLNEASSNLSSLLEQPIPRIGSPDIASREYSGEAEVNRRRAKRRKLESDALSEGFKGFSYGYRGQVVPGPLKMEIVSCDGGLHADAARHGREYWPDNVLRNDKSVYCTDSSKCNIIMRHQGETSFCLKKLVIKAPERGFTAPIQEGMIFVSMDADDLLTRTEQYRIREPSPPPEFSSDRPEPFDDRPPSRRVDSTAERNIPPPLADARAYASNMVLPRIRSMTPEFERWTTAFGLDADDLHPARSGANYRTYRHVTETSIPASRTTGPPTPSLFTITTDCDNHSGDEEEESSAATLADLYRRDRMPPPYESSDDTEGDGGLSRWVISRARAMGLPNNTAGHNRRSRRRAAPSRIEIVEPSAANGEDEGESSSAGIMTPHARFFIEKEKSMISIKFDPPVSGKFLLLKLWSPTKDQNIDIQSIVAHGFAGPRFFPAVQLL